LFSMLRLSCLEVFLLFFCFGFFLSGVFSCPGYGFGFVLVFYFSVFVQIKCPFRMLSMQPG
jgi:hypothetical protein